MDESSMTGHPLRNLFLTFAAFVVTSTLIRSAIPWPSSYGLRAKIEHYEAHADRYDTLFIGSSLTFRAAIPDEIDRQFAERGETRRSFNFGVPGADAFELDYLVGEILRRAPPVLKHVFVEHMRWKPRTIGRLDQGSDRLVYWHSFRETATVCKAAMQLDDPLLERADLVWRHVGLMGRYYTNYARLIPWLRSRFEPDDTFAYLSRVEVDDQRGYQDPDILLTTENIDSETAQKRRALFLRQRQEYEENLAKTIEYHDSIRTGTIRLDGALAHYPVESVRAQVASITSSGREAVYYLTPTFAEVDDAIALRDSGVYPDLIMVNDPKRHAPLYRAENHFDRAHLNHHGGELFSTMLVDDYIRRKLYRENQPRREEK